jgi:hypothetical protein
LISACIVGFPLLSNTCLAFTFRIFIIFKPD